MTETDEFSMHEDAIALLDFWRDARGARDVPDFDAIDLGDLRPWLANSSIVELHPGTRRYFVGYHGAATQARIGDNLTNCYLEDVLPLAIRIAALAPYEEALRAKRPTHSLMVPLLYAGVFTRLERLVLPFANSLEEDGAERVLRFVTWVGPTEFSAFDSESIYDKLSMLPNPETGIRDAVCLRILDV